MSFYRYIALVCMLAMLIQPGYSTSITSEGIQQKVIDTVVVHLKSFYPFLEDADITVSIDNAEQLSNHIVPTVHSYKLSYNAKTTLLGRSIIRVLFYDEKGSLLNRYSLFSKVQAKASFIKSNRLLRQNEILKRDDLKIVVEPLYDRSDKVVFNLSDIVGKKTAFTISKGNTIMSWMLKPVPVVQKNDVIKVSVKNDAVSLILKARALEEGAMGDKIKLKLVSTEKIVLGRIMGDGYVKIIR